MLCWLLVEVLRQWVWAQMTPPETPAARPQTVRSDGYSVVVAKGLRALDSCVSGLAAVTEERAETQQCDGASENGADELLPANSFASAADANRVGKQRDSRHQQTAAEGDQPEDAGGELWA